MSDEISDLTYGEQARSALSAGISRAVAAVAATYGPRGRLVALENPVGDPFGVTPPTLTRDGTTVLDEAEFGSPAERLGVHLLQQTVAEVSLRNGDSTSTAAILGGTLAVSFSRLVAAGIPVADLLAELDEGLVQARQQIRKWAAPPGEHALGAMARRMVNNPDASDVLLKAIEVAGSDGEVIVEVAENANEPFQLQRHDGVVWPYARVHDDLAASGASMLALFRDPLNTIAEVVPLLEAARQADRGLTIIAPHCSAEVITLLSVNNQWVPATVYGTPNDPDWRDCLLDDLSAATGAELFAPALGIAPVPSGMARVAVTSDPEWARLTLVDPPGQRAQARRRELSAAWQAADPGFSRDRLAERLRLFSADAHITVSAPTQVLAKHRRNLVQNAVASLACCLTCLVCASM